MTDRISSPVDENKLKPRIPTEIKKLIISIVYCPKSLNPINDWKETPIYSNIMDGITEFEALQKSYKVDDLEKFHWFRTQETQSTLDESILHSIKTYARSSELDYLTMISKKRDSSREDLLKWFNKANVTYLFLMAVLGQLPTYDYILGRYAIEIAVNLEETVIKFLTRCKVM